MLGAPATRNATRARRPDTDKARTGSEAKTMTYLATRKAAPTPGSTRRARSATCEKGKKQGSEGQSTVKGPRRGGRRKKKVDSINDAHTSSGGKRGAARERGGLSAKHQGWGRQWGMWVMREVSNGEVRQAVCGPRAGVVHSRNRTSERQATAANARHGEGALAPLLT